MTTRPGRKGYNFGVVRTLDARRSQAIAALCDILGQTLGEPVYPFPVGGYRELGEAFARGDASLAWLPPLVTMDLLDKGYIGVLAIPERGGSSSYNGAIIGRADGPTSLTGLEGLTAAWVDRDSSAGYLVPRMHLASRGFDLRKLVGREGFYRSHLAVIEAVTTGRADIGAVHCYKKPGATRLERAAWLGHPLETKIRMLEITPPIPNDALVGAATLDSRARTKLLGFALAPPAAAAQSLRGLMESDAFRVGTSAHYDELRRMVRKASSAI